MKTILSILTLFACSLPSFAQTGTALTSTTLSAAITASQNCFGVASSSGMVAQSNSFTQKLYVVDPGNTRGELMSVVSVPSSTQVCVSRLDQFKVMHASGAYAIIGVNSQTVNSFQTYDPQGRCSGTLAQGSITSQVNPWINVGSGFQSICSTVTGLWTSGWNNPGPKNVTTAVASAAGLTTVSGPLFHITGTNAITGFTLPIGFTGGGFCAIPDGAFTWTTATNIALAGTAVVSRVVCFTWDSNAGKWYPSYV